MAKYQFYYKNPLPFIAFTLCMGLFILYLGYNETASAMRIATNPGIVSAEIVLKEKRTRRFDAHRGLAFTVRYNLSEGGTDRTYTSIANVSRQTYDRFEAGDRIDVRYDPADPGVAEIKPGSARQHGTILLLISLAMLAIACCMVLDGPVRRFFGLNDPYA